MQSFICLNCTYEQHQCFVCKELGSSNISSGAEVFYCSLATCGHFYHPQCVAQLLEDKNDTDKHDLEESIAAGEPFTCPAHKCYKCQQAENEKVEDLQFAVCRRCPKSYHRKCLPKDILFDSEEDNDADDVTRAWNDLLPKSRALIFCLKHKMDKRLHTAKRNFKYPEIEHSNKNEEVVNSDNKSDDERKVKESSSRKRVRMSSRSESLRKRLRKNSSVDVKSDSKKDHIPVDEDEQTPTAPPMESEDGSLISLDADSRERILALVKRYNIGNLPSAQASLLKVEEPTKAVHLALKKLEEGCSVEDVVADCEPGDLDQLWKFKDKLKVYLAPFLDEIQHTAEVENSELNCEVPMETAEKAASVISQKETFQRGNEKTITEEKADLQKVKRTSCPPPQSPASKTRHSDFEITRSGYNSRGYQTQHGRESFSSQQIGYPSIHCYSGFPSKQLVLDPSTSPTPSMSVIERYAPKLDELNHRQVDNKKRAWVYMDASGFDPRPYNPSRNLNSTAGWLDE